MGRWKNEFDIAPLQINFVYHLLEAISKIHTFILSGSETFSVHEEVIL